MSKKRIGCFLLTVCMLASIIAVPSQAVEEQGTSFGKFINEGCLEVMLDDSNYAYVQVDQKLEENKDFKQLIDALDIVQSVELSKQLDDGDIEGAGYISALVMLLSKMDENLCGLYRVRAKNQALQDWMSLGSGSTLAVSQLSAIDGSILGEALTSSSHTEESALVSEVSYQKYCNILTFTYGYDFYHDFLNFISAQSNDEGLTAIAGKLSEVLDGYYRNYFNATDSLASKVSNCFFDGFSLYGQLEDAEDTLAELIVRQLNVDAHTLDAGSLISIIGLMAKIRGFLTNSLAQSSDVNQVFDLSCVDICGDYCLKLLQDKYPDVIGTVVYQKNGEIAENWYDGSTSVSQYIYSKLTKDVDGIALNLGDRNIANLDANFVSDMYNWTDQLENGYEIKYILPQINIDSDDVDTIHAEIYDDYYQHCLNDEYWYDTVYEWYLNGEVLSILGTFDFLDYRGYYTYNVDVITGHLYDIAEAAVLLGVSSEEYGIQLQKMVGTHVKDFIEETWSDKDLDNLDKTTEDGYNSYLLQSIDLDYLEQYGDFYFDGNGDYYLFGEFESYAFYMGVQFLNYKMDTRDDYDQLYGVAGMVATVDEEWKHELITKLDNLRSTTSEDYKNILYVEGYGSLSGINTYYLSQDFGTGYPVVFLDCSIPNDYYSGKNVACYYNGSKFVFQSLPFGSISYESGKTIFFMERPGHHGNTEGEIYQFGDGALWSTLSFAVNYDTLYINDGEPLYYWHGEEVSAGEYRSNMYSYFPSHNLIGLGEYSGEYLGFEGYVEFDFTYTGNPGVDCTDYMDFYDMIINY